ncbi:MAG TPA: ATP-binding protein, partial [Ktedonobacteraceae bacterium]|nr:ATP-binding protein [Ktedonobacteraceae bacterium]
SGFLGAGLGVGDSCLVVATAAHRADLEARLRENGLDPAYAQARGRYLAVDAAETLAQFAPHRLLQAERFPQVISSLLAQLEPGSGQVRIFGEMVALLWGEGRQEAALQLEALWNDLHQHSPVPFSLFCAYPLRSFAQDGSAVQFLQMCQQHGQIIPAESYMSLTTADARLHMISLLQHKVATLEAAMEEYRERVVRFQEHRPLEALHPEVSLSVSGGTTHHKQGEKQKPAHDDLFSFVAFLRERGGEMGALMQSVDWPRTPIGPMMTWPQSLRTAISMCLSSGFPMLILWGPEHVQCYNDAFRPILGAKHPHSMGQCARDCWTEIWEVIQPMFAQILAGGEAIWSEDQRFLIDRYGYVEETFFTFSYSPIRDETGKVGGILCTVKETSRQVVSERRMTLLRELAAHTSDVHTTEEACQSALAALASGHDDMPFALLYLLDAKGTQAHLMGSMGLDAALLDGRMHLALGEQAPEHGLLPVFQVMQSRQPVVIANLPASFVPDTSASPSTQHQACLVPIVRSAEAPLAGVLVAGISPHHAFDEEYRGFFELVASHLAIALSNARSHEEERQRAEVLAELDRAKTVFFSNISHEFRTPLTLSLGPLEALLSDHTHPLDEEQRTQIEMVRRNAQRQLKLVNTLLDFARIEAGRAQAVYQPTDLARLTIDLASAFRSAMKKAGLQFIVDCPPLPEPIYVDRQMWEKIVLNLLSNALKYTFSGFIRVSLCLHAKTVELVVQDSGVGIAKADLPHLLERFYRAHAKSARTQEGSGIGLALVQELVRLHKGSITVESELGNGTTFLVRLPTGFNHLPSDRLDPEAEVAGTALLADIYVDEALHWLPEAGEIAENRTGSPPSAPSSPAGNSQDRVSALPVATAHLLVIDDNADMRAYLGRLLSPTYQVDLAADGKRALALAHERCPDLIISDVMMPELDGFALLKALRAQPSTRNIPVMLLSARAGEGEMLSALAAGAEDYLVKPFSARELLARVAARLEMVRLRKEADLAHERLYELFMQAPAAVVILRGAGYLIELANPTTLRIWGRSSEQVLGKPLFEVFPEVRQVLEPLLGGVLTTGVPYVGNELKVALDRRGDGVPEDAYFTFVYAPLRNTRREVESIMVFAYEVTEQMAARRRVEESEARLRQQQERLSIALSASQTGTFRWNPATGEFLDFDANLKQLFGFAPDEPVRFTEDFLARVHPEDAPTILSAVNRCRQGADFEQEYRVIHPDGSIHWLYGRAKMQRDEAGHPAYLVGACTDITRRKQMEEALRHSAEYLRLLAESMPQKIFTAKPNGDVDYFNPQWSEFTGLSFEQIRDWGWTQFIHPDDLEENIRRWKHALSTGEPFYYEHRFRRADGTYRWHVSRAIPIRDDAGTIMMWIGANTEIEEQKQLEERKDEFLRMASHDLRSPLTAMKGNLQLAQRQLTRLLSTSDFTTETAQSALKELSRLITRAQRQTEVQNRLIGDLLDVSRIQAGKLDLDLVPCDLASLVREIVLDHQASTPGRSITLHVPDTEELLLVLADPGRIGQVVSNYLTNALKYSPASAPITVGVEGVGNDVRVWVRDQGPGLTTEQQQRIWERFYQAPDIAVQSGPSKGLGLGLHICQTLIARHGGAVGVESKKDQGATFWFTLPLVRGQDDEGERG